MRIAPLVRGTAAMTTIVALAYAIALWGFGRIYYLGVFLPIGALFCLITAWFLHLRADGFFSASVRGNRRPSSRASSDRPDPRSLHDARSAAPESARPPLDLFAPRDSLVVRTGGPEPSAQRAGASARETALALLIAAAELAVLATVVYLAAGIGASYFL